MQVHTLTFEQAIERTARALRAQASGLMTLEELGVLVGDLVATSNGARGFFVAYLTGDWALADRSPPEEILAALGTSTDMVAELLTKNLAMSTAMAWAHSQRGDADAAAGSNQVSRRTVQLIIRLEGPQLHGQLHHLREAIESGSGPYAPFLKRWGYGPEQLQAIGAALRELPLPTATRQDRFPSV
ncbi:MAG: hypothetical protein H7Y22_05195 [Gemmatimonadaceae bacterium]|nr:hypothetical protein [Gloeobacterales cyanobacterium ES-bin-141]